MHSHTSYCVRAYGGVSTEYVPDRGLREGCPSSPVLFNIYHCAVMLDFRARRTALTAQGSVDEGIPWHVQVDGFIHRPRRYRNRSRSKFLT
eukprot:131952-Amphidinium_carterae.1